MDAAYGAAVAAESNTFNNANDSGNNINNTNNHANYTDEKVKSSIVALSLLFKPP